MKRLFYTTYSDPAMSIGLFILRVAGGAMIIPHGYDKLINFNKYSADFSDPFEIGSKLSLSLSVFAEFFCAILVIAGLFTRLAVIPLMMAMGVALFYAHHGELFGAGEKAALYFVMFTAILFTGPGRFSADRMIIK